MAIENDVEQLKRAVAVLQEGNQHALSLLATHLKITEDLSRGVQQMPGKASGASLHLIALTVMKLFESGALDPEDFTAALRSSIAVLPESVPRTQLEAFLSTVEKFDPNRPRPAFQLIRGGLADDTDEKPD